MMRQINIKLESYPRGFHLITDEVLRFLPNLPKVGMLNLFLRHTSAGLTINENADSTVRDDFESSFNHLVPEKMSYYTHIFEGDDDMPAHIKSSLVGVSLNIPISDSKLNLGTWQGIYLCEFRNSGGHRNMIATISE